MRWSIVAGVLKNLPLALWMRWTDFRSLKHFVRLPNCLTLS
jgi:hypothetical protein